MAPFSDVPASSVPWVDILEAPNSSLFEIDESRPGPVGKLPLTPNDLLRRPSGDLFGWTQNVGMGLRPEELGRPEVLILSTQGGMRSSDGQPIALGFHTGHFEVGRLVEAAALEFRKQRMIPFAGHCSDPCDGRTQGTSGMFDSLPYRNDAAIVLRRLVRSLPTRRGVLGVATCDKGLPAMMMALSSFPDLPTVIVPGGVTLPASDGEDAGKVQTIGARFAHGQITLEQAQDLGCRACGSPGGGCQFLGTAATSQVVAEALGLALPHTALAPSGQEIWLHGARQSALALLRQLTLGISTRHILTPAALKNAMLVFAACGGSTNLLLHIPAIAHAAGLPIPTVEDWIQVHRAVPRIVDSLPNGVHPTVRVFLAGGVPEVMLQLSDLGLLDRSVLTALGTPLGDVLDWWRGSERRQKVRALLREKTGVDAGEVIFEPARAKARGMTSTITFLSGNLCPEGAVIKSTAIDPSVINADGVYRLVGPVRVFPSEAKAIEAIKDSGENGIQAGEVLCLIGGGPMGSGMEEVYQVTSALKYHPHAKQVALITDARFSGVSTGPCVGHVSPEALAGGPIGRLRDGDLIEVAIDTRTLIGRLNVVRREADAVIPDASALERRGPHPDLAPAPELPDDTRLWAALQDLSGGVWKGAVYDADKILRVLDAGKRALGLG
ncbi:MAG: YjhG/YagF family D-xylonate dehydratase [Polyangiaceae bacterium]|nr:YjhG/YagF family D-xylonate dehydratase [Polyangiaceae bacterium]